MSGVGNVAKKKQIPVGQNLPFALSVCLPRQAGKTDKPKGKSPRGFVFLLLQERPPSPIAPKNATSKLVLFFSGHIVDGVKRFFAPLFPKRFERFQSSINRRILALFLFARKPSQKPPCFCLFNFDPNSFG